MVPFAQGGNASDCTWAREDGGLERWTQDLTSILALLLSYW